MGKGTPLVSSIKLVKLITLYRYPLNYRSLGDFSRPNMCDVGWGEIITTKTIIHSHNITLRKLSYGLAHHITL